MYCFVIVFSVWMVDTIYPVFHQWKYCSMRHTQRGFIWYFCKSDPSRLRSGLANKNKVSKDLFGYTLFSMNFLSVNLYVKLTYKSVPHKAFLQVATITRGRLNIMMSFYHYNDRLIVNIRIRLHRKSLSHTETGPRFREKFLYMRFPLLGELP